MRALDDDGVLDLGRLFEEFMQNQRDRFANAGEGKPVTKPTRVYRVEMPDGRGPYNESSTIYAHICAERPGFDCARLAGVNNEQMGVTELEFKEAHGDAAYGCDSLASLGNWFPRPTRVYLKRLGAKIAVYEVQVGDSIAVVGQGEVIFSKPDAVPVTVLDVVTEE